jgi:HEAT repeat protein
MPRSLSMCVLFLLSATALAAADAPKEPTHDGKPLSEWVKLLGSDDIDTRRKAEDAVRALSGHPDALAEALLAFASDPTNKPTAQYRALIDLGPRAVPALTAGLWDAKTRKLSLLVIRQIGADARAVVPTLTRLLSDPDETIRGMVAGVLWEVNGFSAVPELRKALADRSRDVRLIAAASLLQLGVDPAEVLPVLLAELKDGPPEARDHVIAVLGGLGPAAKDAVAPLAARLPDADARTAAAITQTLGHIGPAAKDAIPALKKRLADEKEAVDLLRPRVAVALWRIARDPDAAKLLRTQLTGKDDPAATRHETVKTLWRIDAGKETLAALAEQLKSETPRFAIAAAGALGDKDSVALLGKLLAHKDLNTRAQAVVALHQLGTRAAGAIEPLQALAKDNDPHMAFWATSAVCRIEPKAEAVAALAGYLGDRNPMTRHDAARALAQLGAAGKPAVAQLTAAMADADGYVGVAAAVALWKIDRNPAALQTLTDLLRHADPAVRTQAALELGGEFGPDAKPAVPELTRRLFDPFAAVRSETAEALGRLGAAAKDAAPAILALLEGDEPGFAQSAACEALGLIEPADKDAAIALLKKKLDHPDPVVRVHAALALARLGDRSGEKEAERGLTYRSPTAASPRQKHCGS